MDHIASKSIEWILDSWINNLDDFKRKRVVGNSFEKLTNYLIQGFFYFLNIQITICNISNFQPSTLEYYFYLDKKIEENKWEKQRKKSMFTESDKQTLNSLNKGKRNVKIPDFPQTLHFFSTLFLSTTSDFCC